MGSLKDTLASYLPWQITQGLADSSTSTVEPRLARFPAAILFVDIVGFTPLVERMTRGSQEGVETLSRLLNSFFGELIDLIAAFGGVVVKFAGDAMVAIWPVREGSLDATTGQAVHCACALQEKVNNRPIAEQVRLFLKVNVEAGETVSALIGGQDGHWQVVVAGESFARLAAAPQNLQPGDIVLSAETLARAKEHYAVEEIATGYFRLTSKPFCLLPVAPAPALDPLLDHGMLRACIPEAVLSRIDAGHGDWFAELRRATVMFISVPGLDYTGPELLDQLQNITAGFNGYCPVTKRHYLKSARTIRAFSLSRSSDYRHLLTKMMLRVGRARRWTFRTPSLSCGSRPRLGSRPAGCSADRSAITAGGNILYMATK